MGDFKMRIRKIELDFIASFFKLNMVDTPNTKGEVFIVYLVNQMNYFLIVDLYMMNNQQQQQQQQRFLKQ